MTVRGIVISAVAVLLALATLSVSYLLLSAPNVDIENLAYLEADDLPPNAQAVTVKYMGNTNLLISDGETNILTDGWFSRFSTWKVLTGKIGPDLDAIESALKRGKITDLAAVVTVHSHFDHAMDAPEVAQRTGALLVGSESTANIGRGWKLPEEQIVVPAEREKLTFGKFSVSLIRSKHFVFPGEFTSSQAAVGETIDAPLIPPVPWQDYREGGSYSILIEHPSGTMLLQGSAGFIPGGLDGVDVDVLFLGIGGLGAQDSQYQDGYWRHVVLATTPELIVPVHWDSLTHPLGDGPKLANTLWADVLNIAPKESLELVDRKAAENNLLVKHLPFWVERKILPRD